MREQVSGKISRAFSILDADHGHAGDLRPVADDDRHPTTLEGAEHRVVRSCAHVGTATSMGAVSTSGSATNAPSAEGVGGTSSAPSPASPTYRRARRAPGWTPGRGSYARDGRH